MMWLVLLLLLLGVFLSALFSGSETGFYRVTRVRLLLDGLDGDVISRMLLRLTNHPALFVATTLVGNNVANYMTSLAVVLLVKLLFTHPEVAESVAPMVVSPVVFVYCELMPKQLFFYTPNRLLRKSGPLLLMFTALFAPIALILWTFGWLLERLVGQTPLRVRLTLARKELQQVLDEGEEVGILHAAQRDLAQQLFAHASENIARFVTPISRVASVPSGAPKTQAYQLARRIGSPVVLVRKASGRQLLGFVRVIDLKLSSQMQIESVQELPRLGRTESLLGALLQLQEAKAEIGLVQDRQGIAVGVVYAKQLTELLFQDA